VRGLYSFEFSLVRRDRAPFSSRLTLWVRVLAHWRVRQDELPATARRAPTIHQGRTRWQACFSRTATKMRRCETS